jgi:hypothetical protein
MTGQMRWLPTFTSDGELVLHLRMSSNQAWSLYTSFPEYTVPEHKIREGSKGYATFQSLLRAGWSTVASPKSHPPEAPQSNNFGSMY